jgi:hypothetical protein
LTGRTNGESALFELPHINAVSSRYREVRNVEAVIGN